MKNYIYLEEAVLVIICVLLVALGVASIAWAKHRDRELEHEWERFAASHECRKVAKISGEMFNTLGFDAKGNTVVGLGVTSDKTGWLCNDGVTYYR